MSEAILDILDKLKQYNAKIVSRARVITHPMGHFNYPL